MGPRRWAVAALVAILPAQPPGDDVGWAAWRPLAVAGSRRVQLDALLSVVPRYIPEQVWWSGAVGASSAASQLFNWIDSSQIALGQMSVGQVLELDQGAEIEVLQLSDQGAILLVRWGDFRVRLPIGA